MAYMKEIELKEADWLSVHVALTRLDVESGAFPPIWIKCKWVQSVLHLHFPSPQKG
jgi:hypothetical protein